jgi:thioesterase domain-containing protein
VDETGNAGAGKSPVLFLMPGILGDEPLLSHFRAAFGRNLRFKVIDYPEWRGVEDDNAGFDAIVDAAFAQICAEPPCESYALAGYSFGGYVAFETARRLVASGRHVGFLGLIDSRMWGMSSAMGQSRMQALLAQCKRYASLLADPPTLARLVRKKCIAMARFVAWAVASRPTTAISFAFYRERNYQLRLNALRRWKLAPLDLPITLFLSDQGLADLPPDYGWGKLCKQLTTMRIGGTHASMLESPRREVLRGHLLDALRFTRPRQEQQAGGWSGYSSAAR